MADEDVLAVPVKVQVGFTEKLSIVTSNFAQVYDSIVVPVGEI